MDESSSAPEELSFPNLGGFGSSAEKALQAIDGLLKFADKYGAVVPGLRGYVSALESLDKILQAALHLFKAQPPA